MKTRFALATFVTLASALVIGQGAGDAQLDARARAIHDRVLKFDAHVDVLLPETPRQYWHKDGRSFADVEKLDRGGINGLALAVAVGPGARTEEGVATARKEADAKLAAIRAFVKQHPGRLELAYTPADVRRIYETRKIAVLTSFLNARSLGKDLTGIDRLYGEGVRLFGFTHAGHNDFADSSRPQNAPASEHGGLSPLGKQAVARLNALGIIIDISQLTQEGVLQTLALSKAPVVASHSAVRALVDNTRSLSDTELDAIGRNNGVVHITAFNTYLFPRTPEYVRNVQSLRVELGLPGEFPATGSAASTGVERLDSARQAQFSARLASLTPRASIKDFVDHLDYVVKRIGVDHVGIGSDFNHGAGITGFADESEALNVTRELVRRGYTEEQIAKIWGGNFLRVFHDVEQAAHRLKQGAAPAVK